MARNKVVPGSLVGTTSSMRERRESPQRQQGFALGYLVSIVLVAVVVVLLAALPTWGYSSGWGYYPSGILAIIAIVILLFVLFGILI